MHKRERHEHRLLIVAVDVHVSVGIVYANNTEVYRVDAYHVATRITTLREEILVYLLAEHAHLAALLDIHLVDISAVAHLRFCYALHIRQHTLYDSARRLFVVRNSCAPSCNGRRNHIEFGYVSTQSLHVCLRHIPLSSFAKSVIRLGGRLRPYNG